MNADTTLLVNVRLCDGRDADLRMAEGIVEAIGPGLDTTGAVVADGGGLLVLPGMIDDHVYLDKTLTGLPWMPYPAGPSRASRIVTERGLRAQLPPPAERASNLVRQAVAAGTTAFRSHADIGPDIALSARCFVPLLRVMSPLVSTSLGAASESGGTPDQQNGLVCLLTSGLPDPLRRFRSNGASAAHDPDAPLRRLCRTDTPPAPRGA